MSQINAKGENDPKADTPVWLPSDSEIQARNRVLKDYTTARNVVQKSYNQFGGLSLYEYIDDCTKRWNGYIPVASPLLDADQSRIFLNFTRNQITSYLAKAALQRPRAKIKAVNKKSGIPDERISETIEDLNRFSLDQENGDARFMEAAMECAIKGTVIVYEGYRKDYRKTKVPVDFDPNAGTIKVKEEETKVYDDCFQRVVPLEDFYIANAYEPNVQMQPFVIERRTTNEYEAKGQYGHYKNWKYVKPGSYSVASDPTTFYRNKLITDLQPDQVEILRYFNRMDNLHIVMINGIIMYDGPIPFKDGLYPYARGINEPFEVGFFWGYAFPKKIQGEQDAQNTLINMMMDKVYASLTPGWITSDPDDLIEDDIMQPNKIRKVGDINKWQKFEPSGVSNSEMAMFQLISNLGKENSGEVGGLIPGTPHGGKMTARQLLLKQQESMQKLGFSMSYLEDMEVERTKLRVDHVLQFYAIPKMEKITGKDGKEIEKMVYRDIRLDDVKLKPYAAQDAQGRVYAKEGVTGTRIIKLVGDEVQNPDEMSKLQDDMTQTEMMGEEKGSPTEVIAMPINAFVDYNYSILITKNSSFENNQALERAERMEWFNWRTSLADKQVNPTPFNSNEGVDYVEESYSVDGDRFKVEAAQGQPQPAMAGGPPGQPGQPTQGQPPRQAAARGVEAPKAPTMTATPTGGLT